MEQRQVRTVEVQKRNEGEPFFSVNFFIFINDVYGFRYFSSLGYLFALHEMYF